MLSNCHSVEVEAEMPLIKATCIDRKFVASVVNFASSVTARKVLNCLIAVSVCMHVFLMTYFSCGMFMFCVDPQSRQTHQQPEEKVPEGV